MRSVFLLFGVSGVAADASNHCNSNDADGHALLQAHSAVRKHKAMSEHVDAEVTAGISHHATSEHDAAATTETAAEVAESKQSAAETQIPAPHVVLHSQGMCPDSFLPLGEHRTHASSIEDCAGFNDELHGMAPFFAYDASTALDVSVFNCWNYLECPCPANGGDGSFQSGEPDACDPHQLGSDQCPPQDQVGRGAYTVYEVVPPGVQPPPAATLQERCARTVAEEEEFVCSQHRETVGTCSLGWCWWWRGDIECVASHCRCQQGSCSNDEGVCRSQDEFTTERCAGMSAPGSVDSSLSDEDRHYRDLVCAARASGR